MTPPAKLFPAFAAWIYPLTFGRARIVIGRRGSEALTDGW